ncbi:MAG: NADP-specific glutamate dehydrogenase [Candidatus Sumerlaeia bacterium]|nr:NADP-specific glutamate dehydrogenase [Candidatus Sumerlaeia bacterium]
MTVDNLKETEEFVSKLEKKCPSEPEFLQAVREVLDSVIPFMKGKKRYKDQAILERLSEPDRVVMFRVVWQDDKNVAQVNRGYRVQFSNVLGPYKGGIRFHPSVNLGILKFLGFEQIFKNSLTGLSLGGAKGGSDFNPKGRSDGEIMRFCQAFMVELSRHIGADVDVPAGDIGVGAREVGYMYGMYRRLSNRFDGTFTGKGPEWGGSLLRPEATGYGVVYFLENLLQQHDRDIDGKRFLLSGSGNVAQHCAAKLLEMGGKVLTLSDSGGFVHEPDGFTAEKLEILREIKNVRRGRIKEYADETGAGFHEDKRPWAVEGDVAIPCATQNEIGEEDANELVKNGVIAVVEGANMPTTYEAVKILDAKGVLFAPGKAANAGGVAVSGLEMAQNSQRLPWSSGKVDKELRSIMDAIHEKCVEYGGRNGCVNYLKGANVGGFVRVADAMVDQGFM